jgi:tripartite-type tricarboxylate transporter receptor subunit TctC
MQLITRSLIAAATLLCAPHVEAQQTWPSKPIRLVINFAPGGTNDIVARAFTPKLSEVLGQPVVIEHRAGAAGNIGMEFVARSAPDGHTLLHSGGSTMIIGPHLYKMPVDVEKDLQPVAPTARTTIFLVARQGIGVRTMNELIAYARANPGKLNFGSSGMGSAPHIAAEMLLAAAKIQATHVPYKGAGETVAALLSGQIDFLFDIGAILPQIKADKVSLLAVASAGRSSIFPNAPTTTEAGTEVNADTLVGVYAPGRTPREIVERLNREIVRALHTPESRAALIQVGAEVLAATPEEFSALQKRARDRFGAIIRDANIKANYAQVPPATQA